MPTTRSEHTAWAAKVVAAVLALSLASENGTVGLLLDEVGMLYYQHGTAIVDSIDSGDIASAELRMRALDALKPSATVVAYVQNSIGVAYASSGRFEEAILHHEEALRADDGSTLGLSESSHASLVYANVALEEYETASRLLASRGTEWAWLLTWLASLYEDRGRTWCALALGERALVLGRAGAALDPYESVTESVDRDVVLRRWSGRVDGIRRAATEDTASATDSSSSRTCVGAEVEQLATPSPGPEP
ncbi:MAG: tetratricopeptide repeat protein [Gammaproteobacteria bacterium]|nr:tetratricopeptide repeat protein [Gammaproteobacteria bacterium]